ncbi:MAG: protein TolQ [Proteobacteria bacterium]|uniref:Tol-Pal system protein TolQ n=1 Tax=Candidatus Avisuccinivibrio stercorigallinarum TaxID=2840704 RepID=A0A9D9DBV1_9GAMM|nr:protein TolQ [Candidatus Avisuccinivibrio stercorigallinarum]
MDQAGSLSFGELILNASFLVQLVMAFLLLLSIVSWTIIFQRSSQYKTGRRKADEFEDKFWSGIDLNNLYQDCVKRQQELVGMEVIYAAGFKEFVRLVNSGPADQEVVMDGTYRQMKVASSREVESLESNLTTLATIGSISPYIGLFGTVWGIMHAFVALAAVKNATLSMVAPPIAEALIATAMGLFAAIPAVMFYNRFVAKVEALENRYLNFMDEFATILNRRLVTIRSQLDKAREQERQSREAAAAKSAEQQARAEAQAREERMRNNPYIYNSGTVQAVPPVKNGRGRDSAGSSVTGGGSIPQAQQGLQLQSAMLQNMPGPGVPNTQSAAAQAQNHANMPPLSASPAGSVQISPAAIAPAQPQPHGVQNQTASGQAAHYISPGQQKRQSTAAQQSAGGSSVYADYSAGRGQTGQGSRSAQPEAPHYITPGAAGSKYKK